MVISLLMALQLGKLIIQRKHWNWMNLAVPGLLLAMGTSWALNTYMHRSIVSNALTKSMIYDMLLPIIVLTEGFNTRKKSLDLYRTEILLVGILIPLFSVFMTFGVLVGLQALFVGQLKLLGGLLISNKVLFGMALCVNMVDIHGSIAPLHGVNNFRVLKILYNAGTYTGTITLILVMTYERMLLNSKSTTSSVITDFLKVGVFSVALGIAWGAIASFGLKKLNEIVDNPLYEAIYTMVGAYMSYSVAHFELFMVSGDVAVFFYGVMMSHYMKFNLSDYCVLNIGFALNFMMGMSEDLAILLVGFTVEDAVLNHYENILLAIVLLLAFLLSRVICFGSLIAYFRTTEEKLQFTKKEEWGIIFSGMIKGPMAFIFANVIVAKGVKCFNPKDSVLYKKTYPLFIVQLALLISIFFVAPINYVVMKATIKDEDSEGERSKRKMEVKCIFKEKILNNDWHFDINKPRAFMYLDEYYFKPMLIRNYLYRKAAIQSLKKEFDHEACLYDHLEHAEQHAHHHDDHDHDHGEGHGHDEHQTGQGHHQCHVQEDHGGEANRDHQGHGDEHDVQNQEIELSAVTKGLQGPLETTASIPNQQRQDSNLRYQKEKFESPGDDKHKEWLKKLERLSSSSPKDI